MNFLVYTNVPLSRVLYENVMNQCIFMCVVLID